MSIALYTNKKYNVTLRCGGRLGPIVHKAHGLFVCSMYPQSRMAWQGDGQYYTGDDHPLDIVAAEEIPEPKVIEGWINIYAHMASGEIYDTKARADSHSTFGRIACIKIRVTEGEGITP